MESESRSVAPDCLCVKFLDYEEESVIMKHDALKVQEGERGPLVRIKVVKPEEVDGALESTLPDEDDSSTYRVLDYLPQDFNSKKFDPNNVQGDWEKHTRCIGGKLMAKMGYVRGTSLGKRGDGIVNPVAIEIFPKGA